MISDYVSFLCKRDALQRKRNVVFTNFLQIQMSIGGLQGISPILIFICPCFGRRGGRLHNFLNKCKSYDSLNRDKGRVMAT